jgi:hypothetical protein
MDDCNCIVGQSYPDVSYFGALVELFGEDKEDDDIDHLFKASSKHGFATEEWAEYPQLTQEWKAYIQDRRANEV